MIEITDSIWILFFAILFLSYMSDNIIYGVFITLIILFLYKYKSKYLSKLQDFIQEEKTDNNDLHYKLILLDSPLLRYILINLHFQIGQKFLNLNF